MQTRGREYINFMWTSFICEPKVYLINAVVKISHFWHTVINDAQ